jgi:cephalosporin-C deacetylase-like acetyl esterase
VLFRSNQPVQHICNPYTYSRNGDKVELTITEQNSGFTHYFAQFQSAIDTGYPEMQKVQGEFFIPKSVSKPPLAILVHGMGDYSVIPCRWLAGSLLKKGVACFIPYLGIHSRRIPESMKERMPYLTPDEWFDIYRTSVTNIRQVVDFAATRDEVDSRRIVTMGISFGGFVSSIAMALDDRIKAGVLIVSGGNQNKMSWLSKDSGYRDKFPRSEEEHDNVLNCYSEYLRQVSEKGFENVAADNNSFLTDPMTFAENLKGRPVFMINALNDKYIPHEAVIDFWKAMGEPPIRWVSSGHTSLWLHYPSVRSDIFNFLRTNGFIS